jgi:hypothetical protein
MLAASDLHILLEGIIMSNETMDIGIPENIEISTSFQQLRIVRRWFSFKFVLLTLFVFFWDSLLISWYSRAFSSQNIFLLLFPLLHVAAGLGLTYYVLTGYLNKTFIEVDFNSLTIRHGPIPFWGNKDLSSKTLIQLYCKRDEYPINRNGLSSSYAVHAITIDRKNIKLITGLDSREQAFFIEQEIEKFLHIQDKPVKGELR